MRIRRPRLWRKNAAKSHDDQQVLLQRNAKVYIAGRSREKAEKAIAALKQQTGKEALFLELNLASLASIKKAAQEFLGKERELHILFNNAYVLPDVVIELQR